MQEQTKLRAETQNFYIFISNNVAWPPFTTGRQVVEGLAKKHISLASPSMPYREEYKKGDGILFYVAGLGAQFFIGSATIAGKIRVSGSHEKTSAARLGLDNFDEMVPLCSIKIWNQEVPIKPIEDGLSFTKDIKNYVQHLKRGAAKISADDYDFILREANKAGMPKVSQVPTAFSS